MVTLAEVLRRHWPQYERQFGAALLPSHRHAVACILNCRTAALGGEVYFCADCRRMHFVYHSCNHRACPQCGQADATEWTQAQKRQLLPVPYYLITFTVPAALRPWLRSHPKPGYAALLRQSAGALQDVAANPKYLGAELGVLSVLHTWGRQLQYHPHVHCVVPAGGLRPDGLRWCRPKTVDYFLPHPVLRARFRTRLQQALSEHLAEIPTPVWQQDWVVDVRPVGSGEAALQYLAAYVYRTALGSQRIICADDQQVTFQYKDSEDDQWRELRLQAPEFIRRFLQHVLPKGFQRVRRYGWLSPAAVRKWRRIALLLDWQEPQRISSPPLPPCCAHCGGPLRWVATLGRAPPK